MGSSHAEWSLCYLCGRVFLVNQPAEDSILFKMLHPRCEILLSLYITEWFHGPVWHYFKHNLCTIKNFFLYVTIQACKTVLISWTYSCLLIKCLCSNSYNYLQPWGSGLTLLCLFTTNQIKENAGWDSCKITVLLLSPLVQLFISKIGLLHRPVTLATKLNQHFVSLVLVKETIVREDYLFWLMSTGIKYGSIALKRKF